MLSLRWCGPHMHLKMSDAGGTATWLMLHCMTELHLAWCGQGLSPAGK